MVNSTIVAVLKMKEVIILGWNMYCKRMKEMAASSVLFRPSYPANFHQRSLMCIRNQNQELNNQSKHHLVPSPPLNGVPWSTAHVSHHSVANAVSESPTKQSHQSSNLYNVVKIFDRNVTGHSSQSYVTWSLVLF